MLLHFVLLLSKSVGQEIPKLVSDSLESLINREIEHWNIPGAAVCIIKDGEVQLMKGFGITRLGRAEKVNENTLFMIASNTKAFTAMAIAQLVENGKCSLDDRVKKWLPSFSLNDKTVEENATLKDLLSHRMGFGTFQGDFMFIDSDLTSKSAMEKFSLIRPNSSFRDGWGYSNMGYTIAAECIEKISGEKWIDYIRNTFLNPLEMKATEMNFQDAIKSPHVAKPHTISGEKIIVAEFSDFAPLNPAGVMASSIKDMSHWLLALLSEGVYKKEEVISKKAIQNAWRPYAIVGKSHFPTRSKYMLYGLGWLLQDYHGREVVWHTGGTSGFVTTVALVPEEDLGILIFTNSDNNEFYEAMKWIIIDAYLDLPFKNYSAWFRKGFDERSTKKQERMSQIRDSIMTNQNYPKLENYTGKYSHGIYGDIEILLDGKSLKITFEHHPHLNAKLEYIVDDRFLTTYNLTTFGQTVSKVYKKDANYFLELKIANSLEPYSYIFRKAL